MIVEEHALVRHRVWRGCGRVNRIRFDGTVDVWFVSPSGKAGMRTANSDDLIPPRRGDTVPAPPNMGVRR